MTFLLKLKIKSRLHEVLIKAVASEYQLGETQAVLLDELAFKLLCAVCFYLCNSTTGVTSPALTLSLRLEKDSIYYCSD